MVEKDNLKQMLKKQHYSFIGDHSAVKVCEWTKKSLRDEGFCYKQKFYGIKSHMCCQMSPAVNSCSHSCIFCWRPIEYNMGTDKDILTDDPKEIVDKAILAQRKLLSGFGGFEKTNRKKLKEAENPDMFAISLSGEPTLYPRLGELISELNNRKITSFVVSNGTFPDELEQLLGKSEPTQMYITLPAPDAKTYVKTCAPNIKDGWNKLMQSLNTLSKFKCKKVVRLTLVAGLNMISPEKYAKIIEPLDIDYVEVKGYVWVGFSRQRLEEKNMPQHEEIVRFSQEICRNSSFEIADEKQESRVVLLKRKTI
ncbi:MAG: 4-demethylwyosine synthase TYW1 [Nanoarchaeota archaeon]|nr:4-demethylwyosine synthase TYW1 [Nanoarchaeota archaeon]